MIREKLEQMVKESIFSIWGGEITPEARIEIERTNRSSWGDYATNVAFGVVSKTKEDLHEVTNKLVKKLSESKPDEVERIDDVVGNGFIHFFLSKTFLCDSIADIYSQKNIAIPQTKFKQKINLEFVSANPTGPLTLGNGRAASYGSTLANIFQAVGHDVTREYYINDIGRQVEKLGESVGRKFLQLSGREVDFPEDLYQGEYINELAEKMKDQNVYPGDLDNQELLFRTARDFSLTENLKSIQGALNNFGVEFDEWFSEKSMYKKEIEYILEWLEKNNLTYEKDGALWFKGTQFDLDADVVVRKSTGATTYLLSDFAYAKNKLSRGFDKNIYIFGADHHGDVIRLKAGLRALGLPEKQFEFILLQLVALKQKGEAVRMSKRAGRFVTLDDLLLEVSADVVKFFFLMKSLNTHVEFDLDLAKEQSSKNPVYYIQYAYARINSVLTKAQEQGIKLGDDMDTEKLSGLESETELALVRQIMRLPEIVSDTAIDYQVHHLAHYAMNLAAGFHKFYDTMPILISEPKIRDARLILAVATRHALQQSLSYMGLSAPDRM